MAEFLFNKPTLISENLKAEVVNNPVKFPKELGEDHPFKFQEAEKTYIHVGLVKAGVDKHIDFIISPGFFVTSDDKKAEELINNFIQEHSFEQILREWIREGLVKGNGFLELSIKNVKAMKFRVVNANYMYIVRNRNGEIEGYNQYIGKDNMFKLKDFIPFNPDEIAHLPFDKIGDCPYGYGMVLPTMHYVENLTRMEKDLHMLVERKANSPYDIKIGTIEEPATQKDIDDATNKLVWLRNYHEWVHDHRTEISKIDFGNISDKFDSVLAHDKQALYMIMQVPAVHMGDSQQNEGIAVIQDETFNRRIQSIQSAIEKVVEERIFKPILKLNGLASHVEMHWGQPSERKINERLTALMPLLSNLMLSPELRAMLEIRVAELLQFKDKDIKMLVKPENAKREKELEMELQQPEVPGEKPRASESVKINEAWQWDEDLSDMTIKEFINLQEIAGFNYSDYKQAILNRVRVDEFEQLKAVTEQQLNDGLLPKTEIDKLRRIMKKAFEKNLTIREIENLVREKIDLRDRLNEGKLILTADKRPENISRTESVRLANAGLIDLYKENEIKEVRWVSAISDRTCPICFDLNGRIFNINENIKIPAHPNCRCTLISILE